MEAIFGESTRSTRRWRTRRSRVLVRSGLVRRGRDGRVHRRRQRTTTTAHEHLLAPVLELPADETIRRVAFRVRDFGRSDEELEVELLAQIEQHGEVVLRQAIGLVEEQEAQTTAPFLRAQ